jgi:hypothetical protein
MTANTRVTVLAGLILLSLAGLVSGCANQLFWRPDLGGAMNLAAREDRFVVVSYWSDFNDDCIRMDQTVFRSPQVLEIMKGTVPVRLIAGFNNEWARQVGVSRPPAFVVYGPEGQLLRRHEGYLDEASFRGFIVAAKLSI